MKKSEARTIEPSGAPAVDVSSLDFELAWDRVVDELDDQARSGRAFVANAFERDLAEVDRPQWLADLASEVAAGAFVPGPLAICPAPKGKGLVRPGARLSLRDRVVYTAIVGAIVPILVREAAWSQRKVDFSPLFHATRPTGRRWLVRPTLGWTLWTEGSAERVRQAAVRWVVVADIAGFYENVSLPRLTEELRRMHVAEPLIALLARCTEAWAVATGRGLPQGVLGSDILAKLYMESLDRRLSNSGVRHFRYADDVRIFCRSYEEAQKSLILLTEALRERGLTLQSAKTGIRPATEQTAQEFEGALPIIKRLNREFFEEAKDAGIVPPELASVPVSVIDELVEEDPDALDPEVSRRAWARYVEGEDEPNRSIFRYVLRRFAAAQDATGIEYCARRLKSDPDTATEILRYYEALPARRVQTRLAVCLSSRALRPYPFTRYLILDWFRRTEIDLGRAALQAIRNHAYNAAEPDYLRTLAAAVLGKKGDHADHDRIAATLLSETDPLRRAQLLCALKELEKTRREDLISRLSSEPVWGTYAAALVSA